MVETLVVAVVQVEAVLPAGGDMAQVVADKGWPTWGCAATCRSRTAAGVAGEVSSPSATPCMPTGGGSGGPVDDGS